MKKCKVFVAAGSKTPNDKGMVEEAQWLGSYLAKKGYTYIQGASKRGLMGATYNAFTKISHDVVLHLWSVFSHELNENFVGKQNVHRSLNLRLEGFIKDTDVLIVLPGGNGTLQEFTTFFEYARVKNNDYKIIIVNYNGFYNPLIDMAHNHSQFGFDDRYSFFRIINVVKNVKEAVKLLPKITKK